jgi:hypothetical protein
MPPIASQTARIKKTGQPMGFEKFLFYVFALILVFAAVRVITVRNSVHAALFLVLAFFTSAALWLLIEAEFLAITMVLVYVGAVMVLFLFVVMMLDINVAPTAGGLHPVSAGRRDRRGDHRHRDGAGGGVRLFRRRQVRLDFLTRPITATPRNWAASCTPSTSIRSRSPR